MKIVIVGGGIGGLCLANALRNANIDVQVFERQAGPTENLAGYGLHIDYNGRKALQNCLSPASWARFQRESTSAGVQLSFRDTSLNLLAERNEAKLTGKAVEDVERRGIGRIELRDILLYGLESSAGGPVVVWGKKFKKYEKLETDRILVHFEDGSTSEGDILVGADGSRSQVQQQYLPQIQRDDLGVVAIAGRYLLDKDRIAQLPLELTNGSLNNIVPKDKGWMFAAAWQGRSEVEAIDEKKGPQHYVVWGYPVSRKDSPTNIRQLSPKELQRIAADGTKDWSPHLRCLIQDCDIDTITAIPLRSMPHLEQWDTTNVTLIGDAIHNMTPMGGVGANTALRDAELLSRLLIKAMGGEGTIKEAISVYESNMRQYANAAVSLSRRNAEVATSGCGLQRRGFRILLNLAQAVPMVMKATIGKSAVGATAA